MKQSIHAHWIISDKPVYFGSWPDIICSNCQKLGSLYDELCRWCGAVMDEKELNNEFNHCEITTTNNS